MPPIPDNTTLIQVGFKYGLNYKFVVSQPDSANQIFTYLPSGLSYALGLPGNKVTMHALQPLDTTRETGYITTLALAYIPSDMVNQLDVDVHVPVSRLYNHPDSSTRTLMSMINPAIPVLAGQTLDSIGPSPANNQASQATLTPDGSVFNEGATTDAPVKGTSVGIGVGVVAGAAVYGAAMFYVARRYKQRRQGRRRGNSLGTSGETRERSVMSGLFMSGARATTNGQQRRSPVGENGYGSRMSRGSGNGGRSIRSAGISAPIMSENSLGWNAYRT